MTKDYYKVLGVEKSVDESSLKKAYRKLSKKYHPDVNPDDPKSEEKFKEVAEAYDVLSNKEKRQNYDMYGNASGGGNPFGGGNMNMDDIFNSFFGQNPFGQRRSRKKRGSDIRVNIKVNIFDVFGGVHKKIKYKRKDICKECNGSGGKNNVCNKCKGSGQISHVRNTPFGNMQTAGMCGACMGKGKIIIDPCKKCKSDGTIIIEEILEFDIPSGIMDGEILALRGKGNSIQEGIPGDLLINIVEIPHDNFLRNGLDIHQRVNLTYKELVLGSPKEITTLDGKIRINIKKGTAVGHILRVPQKGLKRDKIVGDMMIEVWLKIPENIDEKEKEIIAQLKD